MAEIKVERKTIPWWLWLLPALLVIGLIWWWIAARGADDDYAAVAPPAPTTAPVVPSLGTAATSEDVIDDVLVVVTPPDPSPLAGRRVQLTNVRVLDVVGDRTLWVGPNADQRLFVVLKEAPPPGWPTEGDINLNPGQTVNLSGVLERIPDPRSAAQAWGEPGATAAKEERVYLFADAAQVVERASSTAGR